MGYDGNGGAPTAAMATGNIQDLDVSPDTADSGTDRISSLPDDILLDILGRLLVAGGDVRAAARASTLSRRWSSLPWPEIPHVSLDVGSFLAGSAGDEWRLVGPRHRFWHHHHATAVFASALARFLSPSNTRAIDRLSLTFILTRRDIVRRVGDLLASAAGAARVGSVELKILTEMSCSSDKDAPLMIGYGERFVNFFLKDCPVAFAFGSCLTKLSLENLWFEDEHALRDLVRGCGVLEDLSLDFCGLIRAGSRDPAVLAIDGPPRLKTLACNDCYVQQVALVRAPALVSLQYRWFFDESPPVSFGCAPSLKSLYLAHRPLPPDPEDGGDVIVDVNWKLSDLLARDGRQIETLTFDFQNDKIWLEPEPPRHLRPALGGLKELHLTKIPPGYNLSWTLFLLEASPLLESLDIQIYDHICRGEWRKKRGDNTDLTCKPSPDFVHHNLKNLTFQRVFNVYKDMRFARLITELAVNLETLTFGVKTLKCKDCIAAETNFPDPARSRLKLPGNSELVDAVVKKLKDGICTSVQITIHLPE